MNKHQKEKSREIRDIMRSDRWGRMTYKEAKRKWRSGIRAFRIGDMQVLHAWKAADLTHLGFSRNKLREVGQAYHKIIKYCAKRELAFDCRYEPRSDYYWLKFKGRSWDGRMCGVYKSVTADSLRRYAGSVFDIVEHVLSEVDEEFKKFDFVPPAPAKVEPVYLPMTFLPHDSRSPEDVFGKLIEKEQL
jgi:hypothetical protein